MRHDGGESYSWCCSECGSGHPGHLDTCSKTERKPSDPAEGKVEIHRQKFIQGWDVGTWILYVKRKPNCTLPSGVGAAIIEFYEKCQNP